MIGHEQEIFFSNDGSANLQRAIEAGRDERSKAIRDGYVWSSEAIRLALQFIGQVVRASINA